MFVAFILGHQLHRVRKNPWLGQQAARFEERMRQHGFCHVQLELPEAAPKKMVV
jgi:hypothetical protein